MFLFEYNAVINQNELEFPACPLCHNERQEMSCGQCGKLISVDCVKAAIAVSRRIVQGKYLGSSLDGCAL